MAEHNSDIKIEPRTSIRKKKTPFTKEEDYYLKSGIKRHGWGNWSAILRDKSYSFYPSRQSNTLHRRAMMKKFNVN